MVGRLAALPEDLNSALSTHTGSLELPVTLTPGDGTPPPSFLVHSRIHVSYTYIGIHKYINKRNIKQRYRVTTTNYAYVCHVSST